MSFFNQASSTRSSNLNVKKYKEVEKNRNEKKETRKET